ncbi:MAG: hypothetical protein JSW11_02040, partial [Candidatus Heimdallarchaeota archaeon]
INTWYCVSTGIPFIPILLFLFDRREIKISNGEIAMNKSWKIGTCSICENNTVITIPNALVQSGAQSFRSDPKEQMSTIVGLLERPICRRFKSYKCERCNLRITIS